MEQGNGQDIMDLRSFAIETIKETGRKALDFYGKGSKGVRFDEALVTEAELVLNEFFQERLKRAFPGHQIFSNALPDESYTHEQKRYVWVYVPLDGISNFQSGIPIWGVSLALLENFWPLLGCFYMPSTGDFFHAIAGQGAYYGDEEIKVAGTDAIDDESVLLAYSRFHVRFHSAFPGKMLNLGCTSAHICYVANGRADAAIIANETYQDLAASRVILEAAGGRFYGLGGQEIFLNEYLQGQKIDGPMIVSTPGLCHGIIRHLSVLD